MEYNTSDYCVYHHCIGDEVFYVGMGRVKRAFDDVSRNKIWKDRTYYAKKYRLGFVVRIVELFPQRLRRKARRLEKEEIIRLQPIANMVDTKYGNSKVRSIYQPQLMKTPPQRV